jgi:hypothetical protein
MKSTFNMIAVLSIISLTSSVLATVILLFTINLIYSNHIKRIVLLNKMVRIFNHPCYIVIKIGFFESVEV